MNQVSDTIVAVATGPGAGGIGVIRISGSLAPGIADTICGIPLCPRRAHYTSFIDAEGETIDDGIALYFPAPNSFTGEDVVELQGHGSPVVLRQLVERCCMLGARQARAGEFSERAFVNGKLDLTQAEAIADLIAAADRRAAKAARRALDGVFSREVDAIAEQLLQLRVHMEAAIDFADESIDTLGGEGLKNGLMDLRARLGHLMYEAQRGRKLRDGWHVVLVGPPNAGKSSLLNALVGSERAIVTDIAGTTRDTLRETVHQDGLELTLVDTAGLRDGGDAIEREGMRRSREEITHADLVLAIVDARDPHAGHEALADLALEDIRVLWVYNKADLLDRPVSDSEDSVYVSAKTGSGLDRLYLRLRALSDIDAGDSVLGEFTARARHVDALQRALVHVETGYEHLIHEVLELAAEELRLAHDALGEITGRITVDEMLGHIFSTFCIGK